MSRAFLCGIGTRRRDCGCYCRLRRPAPPLAGCRTACGASRIAAL